MAWDPIIFYERLQAESMAHATPTTVMAHPAEQRLSGAQIDTFLSNTGTLVMATVSPSGLPHITTNHFVVHEGVFWLPTMPDTVRLQGLQQVPHASLMICEGQASYHTMVVVEGPVELVESPPPGALSAYIEKLNDASWAAAWVALTPRKLYSSQGENGRYGSAIGSDMIKNMFS